MAETTPDERKSAQRRGQIILAVVCGSIGFVIFLSIMNASPKSGGLVSSRRPAITRGLDVSAASIVSALGPYCEPFTSAPLSDGTPRLMADSILGIGSIELFGAASNITKANLLLGIPNDDPDKRREGSYLLILFLRATTPNAAPDELDSRVTASIKQIGDLSADKSVVLIGGHRVTVEVMRGLGFVSVTVERATI